ncbi:hypothetical protein MNBD_GAMMA23-1657 [hydrothermal vent metagenome]|uniref:Uncharacterized protein n=1 Tax=hydrothermal vent metagenome TaxID=652676 RepID=A0A3B1APJ2_9ZZZZ
MTQFNLETTHKLAIQSYDSGVINIALSGNQELDGESDSDATGKRIQSMKSSFILTPNQIIEQWQYNAVSEWSLESFEVLISQQPELIILGTGKNLTFPDHQALQCFHQAGIGVEVMNTASACRTFNVLVSENRFVVAGLLII